MNPDIEPLEPIDPPDNTGGGGRRAVTDNTDPDASEAQALAIDPPDNTGGG
ncbi:MAG TPA: hypothetical protein VF290_05120 [Pyrinomonadaceae bacterium]